jgi:cholesterol transport system auxiliary component
MKSFFLLSFLIGFVLMVSGCGDLLKPVAEPMQARYVIDPGVVSVQTKQPNAHILQVDAVTVAPGYRTSKMAYLRKPHQLEYFTRNQWVDDPNKLLQQPIIDVLQKSHAYRQVVSDKMVIKADYRLLCQLLQLHQNYLRQPSQVELVMQATLIDNNNQQVIDSRQFHIQQETPFDTPYGGVLATNQAVKKLQQQLVDFVVKSP